MSIRRILVVEDDVVIALDLSTTLADLGYTVIGPATTVSNALGLIRQAKPHAALLDWRLKESTAEIVGDALAALHIPFGFVSAHPRDSVARQHRDRPHLRKPFAPASVDALLRTLGDGQSAARGGHPTRHATNAPGP